MNWAPVPALLLCLPLLGWAARQCEPITIPLCKGIGYNMTAYPNSYGHEKQEEAGLEVHQFYPLVEVNCYKHLKFFLCALYTPICQANYDAAILPCQEVCLEARRRCSPLMNSHGFQWPETLNCEQLPRFSEQERSGRLCAAPPDAAQRAAEAPAQGRGEQSPAPLPARPGQCSCQCGRPFNAVSAETVSRPARPYRVLNVSNCAYSCSGLLPTHPSASAAQFRRWTLLICAAGLALALFTMTTFLLDMDRFPYPERPIFFLALCQVCVAAGFLAQAWRGPDAKLGCDLDMLRTMTNPGATVGSSLEPGCLGSFFLLYYFGTAAAVWWVVLALSWLLAAVPHWSTEWIGKYACYFHTCAWGLPAAQTALALWAGAVEGDPVSGVCFVGSTQRRHLLLLLLLPLGAYFLLGVSCLFVGLHYLCALRSSLREAQHKTSKLTLLLGKIGVFAALHSASVVLQLLVLLYEYTQRPAWEESLLCTCSEQLPVSEDTLHWLALLKTSAMMAVGFSSTVWVLSPKTLQSWRRLCCCLPSPYATFAGPKLGFGADLLASQYQQIPPPPPPLPHPLLPPGAGRVQGKFPAPDLLYGGQSLLGTSPHFARHTLRPCPRDL